MSVYPNAIDGYEQIPLIVDGITRVDAISVNVLREAILNIETELGLVPSGTYDTVSERLDDLSSIDSSAITDLDNRVTILEGQVSTLEAQVAAIDTEVSLQDAYDNGQTIALVNTLGDLAITVDDVGTPANFIISDTGGSYFSTDTANDQLILGSATNAVRLQDSTLFELGSSGDLTISHDGVDTSLTNDTGSLIFNNGDTGSPQNRAILNKISDGASSKFEIVQTVEQLGNPVDFPMFTVDGSFTSTFATFVKCNFGVDIDALNRPLTVGPNAEFDLRHKVDGGKGFSSTFMTNTTGHIYIENDYANGDIVNIIGSDTLAATFEVKNASESRVFAVDGAGDVFTPGGIQMIERTTPSAAASSVGYLYVKDDSDDTELFYFSDLNGTDTDVQITKDGKLNVEEVIRTYAQGGALVVGNVVYQSSSVDNRVELADADDSTAIPPIGVVEEVIDASNVKVVHSGGVGTNFVGLTRGNQYWLDTTAGGVTNTKPTINAYLVGVALSSTEMLIMTDGKEAFVQSDAEGTEVFASGSIGTGGVNTSDTDVRNFREIDWIIDVTADAGAATINVLVEYSAQETPVRYANFTSEDIDAGTATQSNYDAQFTVESTPFQVALTMPVRGRKMRINVSTNTSSVTASINSYRRI
jgi:hypothetical protein